MHIRILFLLLITAWPIVASLNFSNQSNSQPEKVANEAKKALMENDIGSITTRLKVEGAAFRKFNLYFGETKIDASSKTQERLAREIRDIVDRDLEITGGFQLLKKSVSEKPELLKQQGAEGIATLSITAQPHKMTASLKLVDLATNAVTTKPFSLDPKSLRKFAHGIAQGIYETFIGKENLFMLQIAAVKQRGKDSQIVLMDFDGHEETAITKDAWTKASPYFSLDGKTIFYGVISPQGQGIVEQDVASQKKVFRTKKPGINLDPRVLPSNQGLLATLSFEGNTAIYQLSRTGTILHKITTGLGVSLSPTIHPKKAEFAFVSDRSGSPQIYVQELQKNAIADKLPLKGTYNQTPQYNHDGTLLAFTGRDENKVFDIFIFEPASKRIFRVTEHQGRNQEPFFSPSGRFVIFTSERDNLRKPDIFIATLNGNHQYRLTTINTDKSSQGYYSPVIRPEKKFELPLIPPKAKI